MIRREDDKTFKEIAKIVKVVDKVKRKLILKKYKKKGKERGSSNIF